MKEPPIPRFSAAARRVMACVCIGVVAFSLAACAWTGEGGGATVPTSDAEKARRDPTTADLDQLRAAIRAIPHVTAIELTFDPRTFENGAYWSGHATVDTDNRSEQIESFKALLKLLWQRGDLSSGTYSIDVSGPNGSLVGGTDLGHAPSLHAVDLEELFGPRPTPIPSPTK
jgi:hypothetical protein